jgi:hypothetical protein
MKSHKVFRELFSYSFSTRRLVAFVTIFAVVCGLLSSVEMWVRDATLSLEVLFVTCIGALGLVLPPHVLFRVFLVIPLFLLVAEEAGLHFPNGVGIDRVAGQISGGSFVAFIIAAGVMRSRLSQSLVSITWISVTAGIFGTSAWTNHKGWLRRELRRARQNKLARE